MNEQEIIESVLSVAQQHQFERGHAQQVATISCKLFDQLALLHALGSEYRVLLKAAALLHDIGWVQGRKGHHKTGRDMILQATGLPFNDRERLIVALLVRYHRKAVPSQGHVDYAHLSCHDQDVVCKLAAVLRFADGLDRAHVCSVEDVTCTVSPTQVLVRIHGKNFSDIEYCAAKKKADLFELTYKKEVVCERV